ncbi:MAG: DsrH/TusB family sulfur metabolism protein [Promethearchaeota archaeon]
MAKNLILFGHSGFDLSNYQSLTKIAYNSTDCVIVLMEDGVNGVIKTSNIQNENMATDFKPYKEILEKNIPLYCVVEDLEARGLELTQLKSGIKPLSYVELIDLIETSNRVISLL